MLFRARKSPQWYYSTKCCNWKVAFFGFLWLQFCFFEQLATILPSGRPDFCAKIDNRHYTRPKIKANADASRRSPNRLSVHSRRCFVTVHLFLYYSIWYAATDTISAPSTSLNIRLYIENVYFSFPFPDKFQFSPALSKKPRPKPDQFNF